MKGIDIYRGESKDGINSTLKAVPEKAYKESDFVIVKSTQGTSYKYTSFFYKMIDRTLKDGKLAGAYHYAEGNDPIAEADYFIEIVKKYIGKIVLCLDWEHWINQPKGIPNHAWGSKTWCTKFINRVKEKTGVTCFLYTGEEGCNHNISLAGKIPLWFAGYPKPMSTNWDVPKWKYNLGKWGMPVIWQYTSTNEKVDRNTTDWTSVEWNKYVGGKTEPEVLLELLNKYHKYIKEHPNMFYNKYVNTITTFDKAKKLISQGKNVGITCVVPLRWALAEMKIKNAKGLYLISAPKGSFKNYYTGDMKKHLTRITSGGAIGKTVKAAVDANLLKAGDIVCYENLTHTSVYSGKGYIMYEGGGACVVNGHYPHGIAKDYSDEYKARKISEILRWKEQPKVKTEKKETTNNTSTKKGYSGVFPNLPKRGYFKLNDGIKIYTEYLTDIKRLQNVTNWVLDGTSGFKKLTVDGKYGQKTKDAVMLMQKKFSLVQDGEFGKKTLAKCKSYTK